MLARPATDEELAQFHSKDYLDAVRRISNANSNQEDDDDLLDDELEQYGLGTDSSFC